MSRTWPEDYLSSVRLTVTDKSCLRCRQRRVRCDRIAPVCRNCKEREEECDLASWKPRKRAQPYVKKGAAQSERILELEKRLAQLESHQTRPIPEELPPIASSSDSLDFLEESTSPEAVSPTPVNIGHSGLDYRLSTPQMARSLSQHLCNAFFDACCFQLPSFKYFRNQLATFKADPFQLDPQSKISVAVFCAVGARASPHSAVLGIAMSPEDTMANPQAPLLRAGTRRQNACITLLQKAHAQCFERGLEDDATPENLATLLALMHMFIFVELQPKKSRTLLRAALGQYKELLSMCISDEQHGEYKSSFALAVYAADSMLAAYARKAPLLSDGDLSLYFDNVGIVTPTLPGTDLSSILTTLFSNGDSLERTMKIATHLILCWTCQCQRMFARIASTHWASDKELSSAVLSLWDAVDGTRRAVELLQSVALKPGTHDAAPGLSHGHTHSHETDYLSQAIRHDRDLLDLNSMVHTLLLGVNLSSISALVQQSLSRVRKGFRAQAVYCQLYLTGPDAHMIYHHIFQMEHNPNWTQMVLDRIGDPGGPLDVTEEVTELEIAWFTEGLQRACFYTPLAERRLADLNRRFEYVEAHSSLSRFTTVSTQERRPTWADSTLPCSPSPIWQSVVSSERLIAPLSGHEVLEYDPYNANLYF